MNHVLKDRLPVALAPLDPHGATVLFSHHAVRYGPRIALLWTRHEHEPFALPLPQTLLRKSRSAMILGVLFLMYTIMLCPLVRSSTLTSRSSSRRAERLFVSRRNASTSSGLAPTVVVERPHAWLSFFLKATSHVSFNSSSH